MSNALFCASARSSRTGLKAIHLKLSDSKCVRPIPQKMKLGVMASSRMPAIKIGAIYVDCGVMAVVFPARRSALWPWLFCARGVIGGLF